MIRPIRWTTTHAIAASDLTTLVVPTFRPDKALLVDRPDLLDAVAGETRSRSRTSAIVHLSDLLAALAKTPRRFPRGGRAACPTTGSTACPRCIAPTRTRR